MVMGSAAMRKRNQVWQLITETREKAGTHGHRGFDLVGEGDKEEWAGGFSPVPLEGLYGCFQKEDVLELSLSST